MREYRSFALCDQISRMKTCHEVRKEQLAALVRELGSVKLVADLIAKSETQVRQWLNASKDSRTGKPRGISDDMARFIEEKTEKEVGWLDNDPDLALLPQWRLLDERERASVKGFINGIIASRNDPSHGRFQETGHKQSVRPAPASDDYLDPIQTSTPKRKH
jgi:hypothetical protein